MSVDILTIGKSGEFEKLSQGFGLGIRQHDDVMLAYGYSRTTRAELSLAPGEFMILRLDVGDVKLHHSETRTVFSSLASIRVNLYDATGSEGLFPATPTQLDIYNQNGPVKETSGVDVHAEFNVYPAQLTDPFAALDAIESIPLYSATGGGPVQPSPTVFSNVKGRHYTPNKTYALVVENLGTDTSEVYYQYDWHEISGGAYL